MKFTKLHAVILVIVLVSASHACLAQFESSDRSLLGVGMSMVMPSGSQLKKINSIWLGPTLECNLKHDSLDRPMLVASLGWLAEQNATSKGSIVPLKLTYIKRTGGEDGPRWYFGGSIDAYFSNYKGFEYNPFTRSQDYVEANGCPLGIGLLAGTEFGRAWYGEARYDAVRSLSLSTGGSVDFSGLSLSFGTRIAF
jgi:hypothetical protein